jgi:hypothetical protein
VGCDRAVNIIIEARKEAVDPDADDGPDDAA